MGYAILRTQKLKSGIAVRRSLAHAFRARETANADANRTPRNTHIGAANVDEALAKFNDRLMTQDKVRKNAVLAVEFLITASPEDMHGKSRQDQDAYFGDALKWLETKHGSENVVYAGIHRDETTPHMYAYVVPIDARGKLNCRSFLGGAKALTMMQTDFAEKVGRQHGLQRGIEGSKSRHTSIQQYYSRVNQPFEPLPHVTPAPAKLRPEPKKPGLFAAKKTKDAYTLDHAAWTRERAAAQLQKQRHMAEVRAQRDQAIEVSERHQSQAREAAALKIEVDKLRRSNGSIAQLATQRKGHVDKLTALAKLFTLEEIRAAQARRRHQEIEKARQAGGATVTSTEAKSAPQGPIPDSEAPISRQPSVGSEPLAQSEAASAKPPRFVRPKG